MRDNAYLLDMLIAARKAIVFTEGCTAESFGRNELVQNAVVRVLQVLGEAARRLSPSFKLEHSEIPWTEIAGLRNRLVHDYMNVDLEVVWGVVQNDLARLVQQLESLVPRDDN
jgi:uncharacterized protein with HEPN domain